MTSLVLLPEHRNTLLQHLLASVCDTPGFPPISINAGNEIQILEWSRPDLNPKFVHVRRDGEDVPAEQNPAYRGRTSVSTENLKHRDLSLKLSTVELSDSGTYRCYVPEVNKTSVIGLSVDDIPGTPVYGIVAAVMVMMFALIILCVIFYFLNFF
ncbi:myelin-oligodendrocyte glycoprotein-like [Epinephelus fuscoguttatus]|uniref:myelin-oligodendrocyte glycoprotein-like n=1 Tax=Epinephelus fuscoguttatus TaxID=293821 RepID=UPI0020D195E9|nr:myelin-oligodendrocyte glycoprotein-like [Epinephelus fuscoguttatus]